jgi:hypothetical protein
MQKQKITFDEKSIHFVLESIGLGVSKEGYVQDVCNLVKDVDGNIFKPEDIIGVIDHKFITKESQILELNLNETKS